MTKRKKVYGFLALVVLLAVSGILVNQHVTSNSAETGTNIAARTEEGAEDGQDDGVPVELATVVQGDIASLLTATANLRALREVDVAAQVDGVVKRVLVEEGDSVRAGQVLCELDDIPLHIRLQSARQRLAQARSQLEKARIRREKARVQIHNNKEDLARLQKLFRQQLVSEREVAQLQYAINALEHDERIASSEVRELAHRVEELEAEIKQVELEISRTRITAPFSGIVVERHVELGQAIRSLEPLFKLGDFSPLYADVYLSEREARRVRPGQVATIQLGADGGTQARGRVVRTSPIVDQTTGTVKVTVELRLASNDQFKPGAFVRVNIQTDRHTDALLIPKRAVIEEDGETYVFVADGDIARRVKVSVGYESESQVEIRRGLSLGDRVVVAGQGALRDGAKMNIVRHRSSSESSRVAQR